MARSKCIAILFASAIGAWGCGGDSDGSGGSAGSAGSDGTGGSGGSVQNACNNASDHQGTISNPEYPSEFWGCYDAADMDIELSVNTCVQDALGVSANCVDCFGTFAGCIDSGCGDVCNERGANTLPCQECVFDECNMDFNLCSGIAAPAAVPQVM